MKINLSHTHALSPSQTHEYYQCFLSRDWDHSRYQASLPNNYRSLFSVFLPKEKRSVTENLVLFGNDLKSDYAK